MKFFGGGEEAVSKSYERLAVSCEQNKKPRLVQSGFVSIN
jgi:hypothetical protein